MNKALLLLAGLLVVALPAALAQSGSPGWGSARWVWDQADGNTTAQTDAPRYLRRAFALTGKPAKAELWITADNEYVAYLNGTKVGAGQEWSKLDKYDVARLLVPGKNVLAIVATNHGGQAGVIARLHVVTADKKGLVIGTDAATRITQVAPPDWFKADFDDGTWATAAVLGDATIGPWNLASSGGPPAQQGFTFQVADPKIKNRQTPEQQLKNFIVPDGFRVELVAADPLVINPVTMAVDDKGRIYVSESHTYRYGPSGSPIKPFANPLVRLDPLPDGKGYQRVLVADGFDDPVMGIAVKGDQLWVTANNFLYSYLLSPEGKAEYKTKVVIDKNKAWNPFGMFVLEFGPDGMLYMSVGNHAMQLEGPGGKLTSRGGSGIIARMNPDGTQMEPLVQGLRVPYSFEMDPFGQLWVLSNGEGNPDRFVRVIEGAIPIVTNEKGRPSKHAAQTDGPRCVDYHCYSRPGADNQWLAGNSPLAPPCFELHRGAHTQLMRYYAAGFPESYQGSLLACNWGSHGFPGLNRGIFRYVPDARNHIAKKEPFVMCSDPYFRPSHIHLDPDGNLLIADWYGRDDESDLTGRIWRVKYVGKEPKPEVKHTLDAAEWKDDAFAVSALGSPSHLIRAKAMKLLSAKKKAGTVATIGEDIPIPAEPLGAANALWLTYRHRGSRALGKAYQDNPDWRVRRLAVNLLGRYRFIHAGEFNPDNGAIVKEKDPAVAVALAAALPGNQGVRPEHVRSALYIALQHGAAADRHLRYEAAWHLAQVADEATLAGLLADTDENMNLAGLIAIDVACYENLPTKKIALAALGKALTAPGKLDLALALQVAQLNGDASLAPALEKLVARQDVPVAVIAKGLLVLKSKTGSYGKAVEVGAAKRFVEAVEKGAIKVTTQNDQLLLLEFLEMAGPTDFALKQIAAQAHSGQPVTRSAALLLARKFGPKSAPVASGLWPGVFNPKTKADDAADLLATLAVIEGRPSAAKWEQLVTGNAPLLRTDAVRWWRRFKDQPPMVEFLVREAPELIKKDDALRGDLGTVFRHLGVKTDLPGPETDKAALTKTTLEALAKIPAKERAGRAVLGKQVFERTGCTRCHTTATQTTALAPSLKGIGAQKTDYLIESVLFPSKIIKTGFETQTVVTTDGRTLNGLVKEEGSFLRILNLDQDVKIAKSAVEERRLQKVSVMPEGQEAVMSPREFTDLVVYLTTLK